jgi:hypothetical protein
MLEAHAPRSAGRLVYVAAIAGILILLGVGVHLCLRQDNEWERVFVPAAARLWSGDDLYRAGHAYLYPPFTAWATLPFLGLSHAAGRVVFVALNLGGVLFVLYGAWRLAGGRQLTDPVEARAAVVGGSCGIFYIHNCLVHQQVDVFLAALLVGGCLALTRNRSMLAATGFGLAAAMKCTPLLWAPYLFWRRRPAAAAWLIAVALAVNLLPDLVNRPAEGGTWLGVFTSRYLVPLTNRNYVPGSWASEIIYNQSLAGSAQRWLFTAPHWTADDCTVEATGATIDPATVRGLVLGSELLLLTLAALACARPFRPVGDSERATLEYGVVLALMLLLSPMSSMAHFGVLVVPGFCLARRVFARRDRLLTALLFAAAAAALASNKDVLGGRLYTVSLWAGCVMLNTLLLLAGSLYELAPRRRTGEIRAEPLRQAA